MSDATRRWAVRPVRREDREAWERLFSGYCDFYRRPTSPDHLEQIWGWIHDQKTIEALVAVPADGSGPPIGLAHLRTWVRPLRGVVSGYLDDLFVDPAVRNTGVVETLFDAISRLAIEREWANVRWTTADDNYRARSVYDRIATRTTWITYDMEPAAGLRPD